MERKRVIGYVRVSTTKQEDSGLSLEDQEQRILKIAAERGFDVEIRVEVHSAKNVTDRPVIQRALEQLNAGEYDGIICTKLDRLARSVVGFCGIIEMSKKNNWFLIMCEPDIDTTDSNPFMSAMIQMLAVFAEFEREMISERTIQALNVRRKALGGISYHQVPMEVKYLLWETKRIHNLSMPQLAELLEEAGVANPKTGKSDWHITTLRRWIVWVDNYGPENVKNLVGFNIAENTPPEFLRRIKELNY